MRSRTKACSYSDHQGGTAAATGTPPRREPNNDGDGFGFPKSVADDKAEDRGLEQDEVPRRELWQSSILGSVLLTIPSGSKPDLQEASFTSDNAPTQGTAHVGNEYAERNQQSSTHGLRTNSTVASYMDKYPIRGIIVKKRHVSPTHWLFSMTLSPHALDWLDSQMRSQGKIWQDMMTCKYLARSIKARRILSWTEGQYGKHLPTREVADDLVDAYLRTFEGIYRIVHVPTYKRAYEALWDSPGLATLANPGYVVQLQLCLAIGASLHDDTFSLRSRALQWIREAEYWLDSSGKLRLTVFAIQTMCLLHLARQTTQHIREHQVWASSGALVRAAMSVGLHRDPKKLPPMPALEAEMRRRLWATVIELALDASVDAGGPVMFSFDDFDCSLPLNLNDIELDLNRDGEITPSDPAEQTDTSIQIALGRTFSARLSIAKYVNGIKVNHSHSQTLQLSSELMTEYRALVKCWHSLRPGPSKFQQQYCELVISRYIFALHLPYMPRALRDPAQFYLSRTMCIDTALRLSSFFLPLSSSRQEPLLVAVHSVLPFENLCDDYVHLVTCGSDLFRTIPWRAVMVIAAELTATVHQTNDTSPWMSVIPFNETHSSGRTRSVELLSLLREAIKWSKRRIQAGQHNVKDLVYITVVLAGIEAAMEGAQAEEAMDTKGKEALVEAVRTLAEMTGTGTAVWDNPPDLGDEGLGATSEFWAMGFSGAEWDTFA
ncbi:hypothetical protein F4677DRAFT_450224 [Hypoxylon crocopeplum]|nr:hypothetical protein F4677DRAFT_450224 [Hypoxylon crocopeplum]